LDSAQRPEQSRKRMTNDVDLLGLDGEVDILHHWQL
jgi:hypothetical protein